MKPFNIAFGDGPGGEITYAHMVKAGLEARRASRREPEIIVSIDIPVDDLVVKKRARRARRLQLVLTGTEKKR